MDELSSAALLSTSAVAGNDTGSPTLATPVQAEPLVRVLEGKGTLVAGFWGATAVAMTTVITRWVDVPALYARPRDVLVHLSLEILCGAALWVVLLSAANVILHYERRLAPERRGLVRALTVVGTGVSTGVLAFVWVVRPSSRSLIAPPVAWWAVLGAAGVALALAAYAALRVRVRRPGAVGMLMLVAALSLQVAGLERYVRHYGNLQTVLLSAVEAFAAVGSALVLGRHRVRSDVQWLGWGTLLASLVCVVVLGSAPSYSMRRAVLVWGGVAKRTLLSVVWPLADRDHDGTPATFWGVDPDDRRSDVTPRTGLPPWPAAPRASLGVPLARGPFRNLLWITVDTARADSFDRAFVEDRVVHDAFAPFARYEDYVSCSSRTSEAMVQLLGEGRCDSRAAAGLPGHSLLALLRSAGYRNHLLSHFDLDVGFTTRDVIPDDARLLSLARERILAAGEGEALFVHLRGGHAEYLGSGSTPRERYEHQLRASFVAVAELVRAAPAERWAVVVVGDHGEAFGEHLSTTHASTLYQEALRTPLEIRGPNVAPGARSERLSCDSVAWRTLHAAGVLEREPEPLPYQYAALDIAPGELGHLQGDRLRALRVGSLKVVWSSDLGLWELYDLDSDPLELISLATRRPELLAPLRDKLAGLSRECPALTLGAHADR